MILGFVTLDACPPGLFLFGETLCFKSELCSGGRGVLMCDAYVVESGEYFWGGAKTAADRAKLMVQPVPTESWLPSVGVSMTDAEAEVVQLLAEAWNLFLTLPRQHPDELAEFRHALHDLQRQIMARPVVRQLEKSS